MNRTIWKYTIPVNELAASFTNVEYIPAGARFLTCAEQNGNIALWYEIPDPDAETEEHGFQLFGTGTGPIGDHLSYVGTTLHADGLLVLHIYEVTPSPSHRYRVWYGDTPREVVDVAIRTLTGFSVAAIMITVWVVTL